ncbi:MAG: acyl-CoA reductase [Cyclobacteriaceae bacterium]|nr:acyl-CoA reductase [Cyclobacteriaceae bacterium]
MTLNQRIEAFSNLRNYLIKSSSELEQIIQLSIQHNAWYTENSIRKVIDGILVMLEKDKLTEWLQQYDLINSKPKNIGTIMAGNIPLVGFHDFLCVLITGNYLIAKLSSQDAYLLPHIAEKLIEFNEGFKERIHFVEKLEKVDAIIATGSDNSARYFESYFGKYPNIIRNNRTSIAILDGNESSEELLKLGDDIFQYYGLGCRNVSKLFVPDNYSFNHFFKSIERFSDIYTHNKYRNNYEYNKSIYLINKVKHLDNGFLLITENKELVSPISVVYYETYTSLSSLKEKIKRQGDKIQCIVSNSNTAFGKAQQPEVWDYADNIDTIEFLLSLN